MIANRMMAWGGLAVVLAGGVCGCAERPPDVIVVERLRDVHRIAVAPFADGPGASGINSGTAVTGLVINRLSQSGRFTLVERSQLKQILDERDLQAADLVDQSKAAEVGKLIGVDAIVTGSVTQYDSDKTVVYVHVVPIVGWSYRVGASVRIVDVKSGEIIYSHSMGGSSGKDFTEAGTQAVEKLTAPLLTALASEKPPAA